MRKIVLLSLYALMISVCFCQNSIQTINLPEGWSIFSTYIEPSQLNISSVMVPVVSQIIIVKDGAGQVYWPQYGVNGIGNILVGNGYQAKMTNAQNLTITGNQVIPESTPLIIPVGWSMIGYLRIYATKIDSAFSGIVANISITKDDQGNVYWPGQGVNQINIIKPGKGYQIKMTNSDTLIYSSNSFVCERDILSDIDGNYYNTVQIGNQCWMKENLKTTHYSNGTALVDGTNAGNISQDYTTKYWFVYGNNISNKNTYGLLYTWAATMDNYGSSNNNPSFVPGICPTNWHVPSDNEWKQMEMYLGMSQIQADALGFRGTNEGNKLKFYGSNESGFSALLSGYRYYNGDFELITYYGYWWTTSSFSFYLPIWRHLRYDSDQVCRYADYVTGGGPAYGYSVRCVKD
jgi:uncharacterized protein (TIGR02145 family)